MSYYNPEIPLELALEMFDDPHIRHEIIEDYHYALFDQSPRDTLRNEYQAAQIAMRGLDEAISHLQSERQNYVLQCHAIIAKAMSLGIVL